jgi:small subunit ribosomal protein S20
VAQHRSAEKRTRQNVKRRTRNRSNVSRLKTEIKRLRTAIAGGDKDAVQTLLPKTVAELDKASKKGAVHKNRASRSKSRLTRSVNALLAS